MFRWDRQDRWPEMTGKQFAFVCRHTSVAECDKLIKKKYIAKTGYGNRPQSGVEKPIDCCETVKMQAIVH